MGDAELFNLIRSCRNALGKEKDVLEHFATHTVDVNGRHGFVEGTPLYCKPTSACICFVHLTINHS